MGVIGAVQLSQVSEVGSSFGTPVEPCGLCPDCMCVCMVVAGVVGAECGGLVCQQQLDPVQWKSQGPRTSCLEGIREHRVCYLGRFLSRPTPLSLPSFHPTPSTVPTGGRLYLPSADAILECGTCQWTGPWSWVPPPAGRLRVWEAGAGPGKTCHQSCLSNSLLQWRREGCRVTADG